MWTVPLKWRRSWSSMEKDEERQERGDKSKDKVNKKNTFSALRALFPVNSFSFSSFYCCSRSRPLNKFSNFGGFFFFLSGAILKKSTNFQNFFSQNLDVPQIFTGVMWGPTQNLGTDQFSRLDVYWLQTHKQTQTKYIYRIKLWYRKTSFKQTYARLPERIRLKRRLYEIYIIF